MEELNRYHEQERAIMRKELHGKIGYYEKELEKAKERKDQASIYFCEKAIDDLCDILDNL